MKTPTTSSNDWVELEAYVFHLFETRQTQSLEFQLLLNIYGREKLEKFREKFLQMKRDGIKT